MNPKEIRTHPTFESLFPIDPDVLARIEQDMRTNGYDLSQRITLAKWEGQKELVCIDGYTRLKATLNAGIQDVPTWEQEFDTEDEALERAVKLQRNRRNMTDAHILRSVEALDQRKRQGERSDLKDNLASGDAKSESGKSAQKTAETLGISQAKVERTRTVLDHANEQRSGKLRRAKRLSTRLARRFGQNGELRRDKRTNRHPDLTLAECFSHSRCSNPAISGTE